VFAAVGAYQGAFQQLAQVASVAAGYFCSRPLGRALGPSLAQSAHVPLLFGVLAATILVFIAVAVAVRGLLTGVIRSHTRFGKPGRLDRGLGFLLGGLKVVLIAYVMTSALSFVEDNIRWAGRRLSTADSVAFALARQYNLFELFQYQPVRDLVRIAQSLHDPVKAARLRKDPAFKALAEDPRFGRTLTDDSTRRALEAGDTRALLRSDEVLRFLQTPELAARLKAANDALQE
jgi:membrane protein required for colicin V production